MESPVEDPVYDTPVLGAPILDIATSTSEEGNGSGTSESSEAVEIKADSSQVQEGGAVVPVSRGASNVETSTTELYDSGEITFHDRHTDVVREFNRTFQQWHGAVHELVQSLDNTEPLSPVEPGRVFQPIPYQVSTSTAFGKIKETFINLFGKTPASAIYEQPVAREIRPPVSGVRSSPSPVFGTPVGRTSQLDRTSQLSMVGRESQVQSILAPQSTRSSVESGECIVSAPPYLRRYDPGRTHSRSQGDPRSYRDRQFSFERPSDTPTPAQSPSLSQRRDFNRVETREIAPGISVSGFGTGEATKQFNSNSQCSTSDRLASDPVCLERPPTERDTRLGRFVSRVHESDGSTTSGSESFLGQITTPICSAQTSGPCGVSEEWDLPVTDHTPSAVPSSSVGIASGIGYFHSSSSEAEDSVYEPVVPRELFPGVLPQLRNSEQVGVSTSVLTTSLVTPIVSSRIQPTVAQTAPLPVRVQYTTTSWKPQVPSVSTETVATTSVVTVTSPIPTTLPASGVIEQGKSRILGKDWYLGQPKFQSTPAVSTGAKLSQFPSIPTQYLARGTPVFKPERPVVTPQFAYPVIPTTGESYESVWTERDRGVQEERTAVTGEFVYPLETERIPVFDIPVRSIPSHTEVYTTGIKVTSGQTADTEIQGRISPEPLIDIGPSQPRTRKEETRGEEIADTEHSRVSISQNKGVPETNLRTQDMNREEELLRPEEEQVTQKKRKKVRKTRVRGTLVPGSVTMASPENKREDTSDSSSSSSVSSVESFESAISQLSEVSAQLLQLTSSLNTLQSAAQGFPMGKGIKIKPFGGRPDEDAQGWWRKLMNEFELNKIKDRKLRLKYLCRNLEETALDWYTELEGINDPSGPLSSWSRLKDAFFTRFAPEGAKILIEQAWENRNQRHGESVEGYISDILKLGHRAGATTREKMKRLIAGLLPPVKQQVLIQGPTSLEQAIDMVRRVSMSMEVAGDPTMAASKAVREVSQAISDIPKLLKKIASKETSKATALTVVQESPEPVPDSRNQGNMGPVKPRPYNNITGLQGGETRCFKCGQKGHWRRDCPHRGATCHHCGSPQHLVRLCPAAPQSSVPNTVRRNGYRQHNGHQNQGYPGNNQSYVQRNGPGNWGNNNGQWKQNYQQPQQYVPNSEASPAPVGGPPPPTQQGN